MKRIMMAVIMAVMAGAADFQDLQRLRASGLAGIAVPAVKSDGIQIADPDGPGASGSGACSETLSPDAPYDTAAFQAGLEIALRDRTLDADALGDFFFNWDIPKILNGSMRLSELYLNDCSLTKAINASMTKPAQIFMLTMGGHSSWGGMVLYMGDIFAEGFYRNRSGGVEVGFAARRKYTSKEILTKQPWYEWDAAKKAFTPHVGGAALRLGKHAAAVQGSRSDLLLYRGTNEKYSVKENVLATINTFAFDPFGAIFTTPDYQAAKNWANPVVLSSRIQFRDLADAVSADDPNLGVPKLYVGVEFGYVEAAFLYRAGDKQNLFMDNLTDKCIKAPAKGPITEICR